MTEHESTAEQERNPHALRERILALSGEDVGRCIQCGKCTAGCPVAPDVQPTPNQVMQLIRMNDLETLMGASMFWYCSSCQTCTARCPMEIDIEAVMNTLRRLVLEAGGEPAEKDVATLNKVFLRSLRAHGRIFEFGVVMNRNLRTGKPLRDAMLGPAMFGKGKLGLRPHNVRQRKKIKRIIEKARRFERVEPGPPDAPGE
ncbi:MAG: 4Fe-4S dicluster domain-containing protein [Deltaproteobacteria bacterium]|nr:4Fe-4S dicluster domain-containing protein [Deltaproteobacteria bacterium]